MPSHLRVPNARVRVKSESLMHESESSPSHSVLESKSSHESLNLAHESDSSPSPGLEYYNTALSRCARAHTRTRAHMGTTFAFKHVANNVWTSRHTSHYLCLVRLPSARSQQCECERGKSKGGGGRLRQKRRYVDWSELRTYVSAGRTPIMHCNF